MEETTTDSDQVENTINEERADDKEGEIDESEGLRFGFHELSRPRPFPFPVSLLLPFS